LLYQSGFDKSISLFLVSSDSNLQTLTTKTYAIRVNTAFPKIFNVSRRIF